MVFPVFIEGKKITCSLICNSFGCDNEATKNFKGSIFCLFHFAKLEEYEKLKKKYGVKKATRLINI